MLRPRVQRKSATPRRLHRALVVLAFSFGAASCGKCGASSATTAVSSSASAEDVAPASATTASALTGDSASAASVGPIALPPVVADVPEVKDPGPGRATAGLKAAFQAYGITVDSASVDRDAKVTDDGASIDDLEDVANHDGLDAKQVVAPREHALIPEAKLLPAITILEGVGDEVDFVLLWRVDGDKVEIMDPNDGRSWQPKSEIAKRLHTVEVTIPAADWTAAEASDAYREAVRVRLEAHGIPSDAAKKKLGVADPTAVGALDAIARQMDGTPAPSTVDPNTFVDKAMLCAVANLCDGAPPLPDELWSAHPAGTGADGTPLVRVRGAVMLVIAGKRVAPP